jgi:hypothetical protein
VPDRLKLFAIQKLALSRCVMLFFFSILKFSN